MLIRTVIVFHFLFTALISNGQATDQDSCGNNESPFLNKCEAVFFDSLFATMTSRKEKTNFLNKKIAFFYDYSQVSKEQFFILIKGFRGPKGVDILNDKQKDETGYDAIVMVNLKSYQKDYFVNKLKSKSSH